MNKHDQVITDLVIALDAIVRAAEAGGQLPYIHGIAEQAIKNCQAQQARNKDGYLVTIDDGGPAFPSPGETRDDGVQMITVLEASPGMSLRAYIATHVLAVDVAGSIAGDMVGKHVSFALQYADALIAALKGGDRG